MKHLEGQSLALAQKTGGARKIYPGSALQAVRYVNRIIFFAVSYPKIVGNSDNGVLRTALIYIFFRGSCSAVPRPNFAIKALV